MSKPNEDTINRVPTVKNNPMFGKHSISKLIRWFKGKTIFIIHKNNPIFVWQPRFYDHITRDEKDYESKAYYILNNPANWDKDDCNEKQEKRLPPKR